MLVLPDVGCRMLPDADAGRRRRTRGDERLVSLWTVAWCQTLDVGCWCKKCGYDNVVSLEWSAVWCSYLVWAACYACDVSFLCKMMGTESKEDLFNKIHLHMLLEVWLYRYLGDLLAQNGAMEVDDRWFLKSIQPVPPRNEKNVSQLFHFQWPLGAHPNNEGESI